MIDPTLYDLNELDYSKLIIGQTIRAMQIFRCWWCGHQTNKYTISDRGKWGMTVPPHARASPCPYQNAHWHWLLYRKYELLSHRAHPKTYKEELKAEIQVLRSKYREKIQHDVLDVPLLPEKPFTFDDSEEDI